MTTEQNKHKALCTEISAQPAIYVGTYAKYNNGSIKGAWVDLDEVSDYDEFMEICAELHNDEQDPELMFQDWQSIPDRFIGESWLKAEYFEHRDKLAAMSTDEAEAYEEYVNAGYDGDNFEEAFQGNFKDEEDFAYHIVEECYDLEKTMGNLASYFDYEKFGRDLFMGDYWISDNGNVFRCM